MYAKYTDYLNKSATHNCIHAANIASAWIDLARLPDTTLYIGLK